MIRWSLIYVTVWATRAPRVERLLVLFVVAVLVIFAAMVRARAVFGLDRSLQSSFIVADIRLRQAKAACERDNRRCCDSRRRGDRELNTTRAFFSLERRALSRFRSSGVSAAGDGTVGLALQGFGDDVVVDPTGRRLGKH